MPDPTSPRYTLDPRRLGHIFRDAPGHFADDTPENRRLLEETANQPENDLGHDSRYGNRWFARIQPDGTQIWVKTRGSLIIEGGINPAPRPFNPETGLAEPPVE